MASITTSNIYRNMIVVEQDAPEVVGVRQMAQEAIEAAGEVGELVHLDAVLRQFQVSASLTEAVDGAFTLEEAERMMAWAVTFEAKERGRINYLRCMEEQDAAEPGSVDWNGVYAQLGHDDWREW